MQDVKAFAEQGKDVREALIRREHLPHVDRAVCRGLTAGLQPDPMAA
jgi:hypothetical protein